MSRSDAGRSWLALFRHPLFVGSVLAVVSGVLASLLIPALTRVWQDRPKELTLKRDLVQQISTLATGAIDKGNRFSDFAKDFTTLQERNHFLNGVTHSWKVQTSVIGSQLNTYFHETSLPDRWKAFVDAVDKYFAYEAKKAFANKRERTPADEDLDTLRDHFREVRFHNADAEDKRKEFLAKLPLWRLQEKRPELHKKLPQLLYAERDEIENDIVESDASGFSHGFWIFQ
jgi:hypothetical protein